MGTQARGMLERRGNNELLMHAIRRVHSVNSEFSRQPSSSSALSQKLHKGSMKYLVTWGRTPALRS